jgi:hypothetical protein
VIGLSGRLALPLLTASRTVPGVQTWAYVLHQSFWFQADLFAFGMVVAILSVERDDGRLRLPAWWPLAAFALILAALGAAAVVRHAYQPMTSTCWGVAFAAALALVTEATGSLWPAVLAHASYILLAGPPRPRTTRARSRATPSADRP